MLIRITDEGTGQTWTTTLDEFVADNMDAFEISQIVASVRAGRSFTTWSGFIIEPLE